MFYFMNHLPFVFAKLGGIAFAMFYICSIMFARVFFQCHYIGDVLVGATIGLCVALSFEAIESRIYTDMLAKIMFPYFEPYMGQVA